MFERISNAEGLDPGEDAVSSPGLAILLDNAHAIMGAGLPSAILASLLFPERSVMAVCGDGGFMMNSQELETAVRLNLNLVVLLIEDNAFGMIRWKQAVDDFPHFGLTFGNPDFIKYAEAYGAKAAQMTEIVASRLSLEDAFTGGGAHLVIVPIHYSENKRVLVDELALHLPVTGGDMRRSNTVPVAIVPGVSNKRLPHTYTR